MSRMLHETMKFTVRSGQSKAPSIRGRSLVAAVAVSALTLTGCAGGASEGGSSDAPIKLTFTTIASPGSALQDSLDWWMDEVEERTAGAVKFERFYGGALVGAVDSLPAIADGRADTGYLVPVYSPAALPLWNVGFVPGSGKNTEAHMRALRKMNEENAAFQEELKTNNIKVEVFTPVGPIDLAIAPQPFESVAELSGKRFRAAGPAASALERVGVSPVALETHESYEAIERGTIDGVNGTTMDTITSLGLEEVAPWMTSLGLGTWGTASFVINRDVWAGLPAEVQKVMDEVSDDFYDVALDILTEREASVCDKLIAAGGGAVALPAAESKKWVNDMGDTLWEGWRKAAQKSGASTSDIESVEAQFRDLNAQYAKSVTYESGAEKCVQKTSSK